LFQGADSGKNGGLMVTPFDAREITVLISAVFVCACSIRFRADLQRVPSWQLLNAAMACLVVGGLSTVLEHFAAYTFFNVVEHAAYFLQSVTLALWALRIQRVRG
jgi:hypothetical protein